MSKATFFAFAIAEAVARVVASGYTLAGILRLPVAKPPFEAHAANVSQHGLLLTRLCAPGGEGARVMAIELALPGMGETIWAKAVSEFNGSDGDVHREGIRLVGLARKHERMLRDFVMDVRLRQLALS